MDSTQWPEIWEAACKILEEQIGSNLLRVWIQPLEFVGSEPLEPGFRIRLGTASAFVIEWVTDHYRREIEEALSQVVGQPCKVHYIILEKSNTSVASPAFNPLQPPVLTLQEPLSPPTETDRREQDRGNRYSTLDPRYIFESFVVGASNQFAHASAIAVSERPANQYNPLFIYSPPGLGKTHLLHAIGNHVLSKNPDARVAYLSAETFVNELIESIQHHKMPQFRNKFRNSYDVLLIDDIQFIAGRLKTEEEFFHTFNALHGSNRQIVLSSDRPPKDIEGLEERIRTRFEWGLVVDIAPPEIETRIAILKAKAERDDIYIPDEVATFLATVIKDNVRQLEGVLVRLQAQASLTGAEISLEMAKQELKQAIPEESSYVTAETIQSIVARHYNIKVNDLKSTTRAQSVALPRQIAMYLIRKYTGIQFKDIGQYFGGRDHTTIMHGYNKISKAFESDPSIRHSVETIQNLL